MKKKQIFKILSKANNYTVAQMAFKIKSKYKILIVKEPEKGLTMIKMREPVKSELFYLGEVMVTEAIVEIDGTRGIAVAMGDNYEKTLNMAIIDAACNKEVFEDYDLLEKLNNSQKELEEKENAMFMSTKVNFSSMDSEV